MALAMDLEMMTACGGRERSCAEWARLLAGAGFQLLGCRPIVGYIHIITACPSSDPKPYCCTGKLLGSCSASTCPPSTASSVASGTEAVRKG